MEEIEQSNNGKKLSHAFPEYSVGKQQLDDGFDPSSLDTTPTGEIPGKDGNTDPDIEKSIDEPSAKKYEVDKLNGYEDRIREYLDNDIDIKVSYEGDSGEVETFFVDSVYNGEVLIKKEPGDIMSEKHYIPLEDVAKELPEITDFLAALDESNDKQTDPNNQESQSEKFNRGFGRTEKNQPQNPETSDVADSNESSVEQPVTDTEPQNLEQNVKTHEIDEGQQEKMVGSNLEKENLYPEDHQERQEMEKTIENLPPEEKEKSWIHRINKEDAWAMTKPWLSAGASVVGLKGLYDVPEYLRERIELRGVNMGGIYSRDGLRESTATLLKEKSDLNNRIKNQEGVDIPTRQELYRKLTELEENNATESDEYLAIEKHLESTRPTAVREAIAKVNKKLSFTKEGEQKKSVTRNEMARILRENRNVERLDREKVNKEVSTLLDDYAQQKVDGITATKEGLRTTLLATGVYHFAAVSSLLLDAKGFADEVGQQARREGEDFTIELLKKRFGEAVKDNWNKLKGVDESRQKGLGRRWVDRMSAAAKFSRIGFISAGLGFNTESYADDIDRLAEFTIDKVPANFTDHLDMLADRIKSVGRVGSFFFGDVQEGEMDEIKAGAENMIPATEEESLHIKEPTLSDNVKAGALTDTEQAVGNGGSQPASNTLGFNDVEEKLDAMSEAERNILLGVEEPKTGDVPPPPPGPYISGTDPSSPEGPTSNTDEITEGMTDIEGKNFGVYGLDDSLSVEPPTEGATTPPAEVPPPPESPSTESVPDASATPQAETPNETAAKPLDEVAQSYLKQDMEELAQDIENAQATKTETQGEMVMNQFSEEQADMLHRQDFEAVEKNIAELAAEIKATPGYDVQPGDNIWKIIENKLEAHDLFRGLEEGQQTHLIDELKDRVVNMSEQELKDFGIASGNPELITTEDTLDFSKIIDTDSVQEATDRAEALSDTQIKHIESYTPPQPGSVAEAGTSIPPIEDELDAHDLFKGLEGEQRTHIINALQASGINSSDLDIISQKLEAYDITNSDLKIVSEKGLTDFLKTFDIDSLREAASNGTEFTQPETAPGDTSLIGSEQAEQLADQSGEFGQEVEMMNQQAPEFKAEQIINQDLDELYGSEGIFGFLSLEGKDSIDWKDIRGHAVTDLMNKTEFPAFNIYDEPVNSVGFDSESAVTKAQDYVEEVIKRSGLNPEPKESVNNFLHRAIGSVVQNEADIAIDDTNIDNPAGDIKNNYAENTEVTTSQAGEVETRLSEAEKLEAAGGKSGKGHDFSGELEEALKDPNVKDVKLVSPDGTEELNWHQDTEGRVQSVGGSITRTSK